MSERSLMPGKDAVTLAWVGGIALAVLAYLVGPDRVVSVALDAFGRASWYVDGVIRELRASTVTALRAVAIGLFGTFVLLSLVGIRRGGGGIGALVVVAMLFGLLVWGATGLGAGSNTRWMLALGLAALAALSSTQRLRR